MHDGCFRKFWSFLSAVPFHDGCFGIFCSVLPAVSIHDGCLGILCVPVRSLHNSPDDGSIVHTDILSSMMPSASPVTPFPMLPLTGSTSGTVKDGGGVAIPKVPLVLTMPSGTVVATTSTNDVEAYLFINVPPGNYSVVEIGLTAYPVDISDVDTSIDGDVSDANTTVDNIIGVPVEQGEKDDGNDFVDSTSKVLPFSPSPYCNEVQLSNACVVCEPFRSPDYCDPLESFP